MQIIPFEEGFDYKYDIFDVTKVVLHEDYPLIPVGRMVLDRNPKNYRAGRVACVLAREPRPRDQWFAR